MFKTIKSKIITIAIVYTIFVISISLISSFLLANYYFESNIPTSHNLVYSIDNTDTLLEIQDINSFDNDNISNLKDVYSTNSNEFVEDIIIPVILINLFLLIISIVLFSQLYDNLIKPLLDINNNNIDDFQNIKDAISNKDNLIKNNEQDINKINNYIAHEMKNSLSILQSKLNSDSTQASDYIQEMALQIDDINALTLSKIYNVQTVDFITACSNVIEDMKKQVILNFDENEEYELNANQNLLERVIHNILENGYKYGASKVQIDISKTNNNIICKISNNGDKIDYNKIDKIFNYQYRVDTVKTDGYGVGLSLVKNIIELLNGSIYVESNDNITSFYLSIPVK